MVSKIEKEMYAAGISIDTNMRKAVEFMIRRCAAIMDPGEKPCDCIDEDNYVDCLCRNYDDYAEARSWCSDRANHKAILSLLEE